MNVTSGTLPHLITGDAFEAPKPDNDDLRLKPDWMTLAEFSQYVDQRKARLRRRLAADPGLLNSPEFRVDWDIVCAMERCGAFHLFGQRQPATHA